MTTITNLVVALMIVTTGEEQVQAVPVMEIPHEGGVYQSYSFERETLWRKVNQTNFVFSAMIDTPIRGVCHAPDCWAEISCDIDDLFGRPIAWFGVYAGENAYCEKHKYTKDDKKRFFRQCGLEKTNDQTQPQRVRGRGLSQLKEVTP